MKIKLLFFAISLIVSGVAFSANDHGEKLLQSVPRPNSKLSNSEFMGAKATHSHSDEISHLRELVSLQAKQIKLLQNRISELEKKNGQK